MSSRVSNRQQNKGPFVETKEAQESSGFEESLTCLSGLLTNGTN